MNLETNTNRRVREILKHYRTQYVFKATAEMYFRFRELQKNTEKLYTHDDGREVLRKFKVKYKGLNVMHIFFNGTNGNYVRLLELLETYDFINVPYISNTKKKKRKKKYKNKGVSKMKTTYHAYLRTRMWQNQRINAFAKYGKICLECNKATATVVHHRNYLGEYGSVKELKALAPLCRKCHKHIHQVSEIRNGILVKKKNKVKQTSGVITYKI